MYYLLHVGKPQINDLNKFVRPKVARRWHDLGVELLSGVEDGVDKLYTIRENFPRDVETCCTEMFTYWLDKKDDASWNTLVTALEAIGYNVLAKDLKKRYSETVYLSIIIYTQSFYK